MNLAALTKRDMVAIARHLGMYRGDSERVSKQYFEDLLSGVEDDEIAAAIEECNIRAPGLDDDAPRKECATKPATVQQSADPAAAMAQAIAAMMAAQHQGLQTGLIASPASALRTNGRECCSDWLTAPLWSFSS